MFCVLEMLALRTAGLEVRPARRGLGVGAEAHRRAVDVEGAVGEVEEHDGVGYMTGRERKRLGASMVACLDV